MTVATGLQSPRGAVQTRGSAVHNTADATFRKTIAMRLSRPPVAVFVVLACIASHAAAAHADAIYVGGPIITVDDRAPLAEAVAVKAGKAVAVGSRSSVEMAHKGPRTTVIDLAGRTMIPGFIDAHGHMWGAPIATACASAA